MTGQPKAVASTPGGAAGAMTTGGQPKDGIYLDAALAVVGAQVDERIDALSRRRRGRTRFAVAALSVLTVVSGSVAAYAVVTAQHAAPPAAAPITVTRNVSCIEGTTPTARAYFDVRFRIDEKVDAAPAAICAAAREVAGADASRLASLSPDQAISVAADVVRAAANDADGAASRALMVDAASFGVLWQTTSMPGAVCESAGGRDAVVLSDARKTTADVWSTRCGAAGFRYAGAAQ